MCGYKHNDSKGYNERKRSRKGSLAFLEVTSWYYLDVKIDCKAIGVRMVGPWGKAHKEISGAERSPESNGKRWNQNATAETFK